MPSVEFGSSFDVLAKDPPQQCQADADPALREYAYNVLYTRTHLYILLELMFYYILVAE